MGEVFLNTIRQIGIFIICAQAVMYFKRNESYEKYLKLLVSMMVMIQLLIPVFSMFRAGGSADFEKKIAEYNLQMETNIGEIKLAEILAEEKLREMTLKEVEERVLQSREEEAKQEAAQEEKEGRDTAVKIEEVEVKTGD